MENKELLEKSSESESNDLASNINVENESETAEMENDTTVSTKNNDEIDTDHSQIDNKLTEVKTDIAIEEKPTKNNENENKNCTLNRKKDEKLKNIMTYSAIPFILVAIVISIFNKIEVRYPLSFLFISIGIGILAVFNFIRSYIINKSCKCKDCIHHSKSSFKYGIFYSIVTLCFLGIFIYYMVI